MPTQTQIKTNSNSRTARSAHTSSLVRQIQKASRKSTLGSICAQLDDKSHRSHEGRGPFRSGTMTNIVEDLKSEFPWIICNIIDKDYRKHAQSFVEAPSLSLAGSRSNIPDMQDIQVNLQILLPPPPSPLPEPPLPITKR